MKAAFSGVAVGPPWHSTRMSGLADRAAGRQSQVADDDVGAGLGHVARVLLRKDVGRGEQVELPGSLDQLNLEGVAHAGFFELSPDHAVEQPHGREVLDARESELAEAPQERIDQQEGIGAVDPGEHRRALDHRQDLVSHLDHDLVGVAVGQEAGERAAPGHPIASRVVDDDEVDAAGLLALGGQAGAGAAADDRLAAAHHPAQPGQDIRARNSGHGVLISLKFATRASANAWSLMWCGTFSNRRFVPARKLEAMTSNKARSAAGSQNGPPGRSRPERPPSGMRKRTGPSIRFSLSTMNRPMRVASSTVVRINVTFGLCAWRFRSLNCGGTVDRAQKLTMSSAPQ